VAIVVVHVVVDELVWQRLHFDVVWLWWRDIECVRVLVLLVAAVHVDVHAVVVVVAWRVLTVWR